MQSVNRHLYFLGLVIVLSNQISNVDFSHQSLFSSLAKMFICPMPVWCQLGSFIFQHIIITKHTFPSLSLSVCVCVCVCVCACMCDQLIPQFFSISMYILHVLSVPSTDPKIRSKFQFSSLFLSALHPPIHLLIHLAKNSVIG